MRSDKDFRLQNWAPSFEPIPEDMPLIMNTKIEEATVLAIGYALFTLLPDNKSQKDNWFINSRLSALRGVV